MNKIELIKEILNWIVMVLGIITVVMIILAWRSYFESKRTPEQKYMRCYRKCAKKRGYLPPMTEDICLQECVPIYMEEKLK